MSYFSDERMAELRQIFFESAQELLQALNEEALKLEKDPADPETARSIRRAVHTLKGDSAACGFRELSELAHELEDALTPEIASATPARVAELVLSAADFFDSMLAAYRGSLQLPNPETLHRMVRELESLTGIEKQTPTPVPGPSWSTPDEKAIANALASNQRVVRVLAQIDAGCAMPAAAQQLLRNVLEHAGGVLAMKESDGAIEVMLVTDKAEAELKEHCLIPHIISNVRVGVLPAVAAKLDGTPVPESVKPKTITAETRSEPDKLLRVDAARIDQVLNLIGELVIGRSMLQQILNDFRLCYPKDPLRHRFADVMAYQTRVLNDLQRSAMQVRMVPVEQLFRRFPRVVRDVSRRCRKEVALVVSGQETEVDKSILDALAEPLAHIIRNAIDHGIETPDVRAKSGKPAQGTVRLAASHQGNQVVVEVSDDGHGLDTTKILAKATERGLLGDNSELSETEILQLIFRPGFSTADQITEVSGRGVGLDVVQDVLQRMKGSVSVDSQPGQGTRFLLKVPLTIAIIKALLFRVNGRLYAVPLSAVLEISRARETSVHRVDNCEILQLRDSVLTLVRLGELHQGNTPSDPKLFIVIVQIGDRKYGLIVDELVGEEELVIKPLDDRLVATDLLSGASILGDGSVVLILNLASLVQRHAQLARTHIGRMVNNLLSQRSEGNAAVPAFTGGRA